jgi:TRAP transporter 4TM/12TM fusion protein
MVGLIVFFLLYTHFGGYIPGSLGHAGFSVREILDLQFLTYNGVFTTPTGVMSTFIIIFLIFAGILMKSNAVYGFMDLATRLLGHTTGGPAKAAIIASTLMGSVSGSAAANTMVTGSISIPLMKKMGYKPHFAGAVEASVSSGGQFMPPIMGASAFVIAGVLGIPYIKVCLHALFPALFWFFCFFVTLDFEARRLKLQSLSREELPKWGPVLKQQYFLIPIVVLVYFLIIGYSPMYAGFITVAMLFVLTFISKETRFTVASFLEAMKYGMNSGLPIASACAGAGIIIGCVMQSGMGYYLSAALVNISSGSLFILLILVLIASLIMGMGMVTVGAYIIVSILVSPAMIQMGVTEIGAHLYPFYFAIISAITPPVAVASYAGAGIAQANPWDTGVEGMRLAIPALAIPFVFVTQPGLLFIGSAFDITIVVVKTFFGVCCLAAAVIGYQFRPLNIFERLMQAAAAVMLFFPLGVIPAIGLGIMVLSGLIQKFYRRAKVALAD